jgi:hypothetical protein
MEEGGVMWEQVREGKEGEVKSRGQSGWKGEDRMVGEREKWVVEKEESEGGKNRDKKIVIVKGRKWRG